MLACCLLVGLREEEDEEQESRQMRTYVDKKKCIKQNIQLSVLT